MANDILLNDDGDLDVKDGDLVVGFSDDAHVTDILFADKGNYKQHPLAGAAVRRLMNGKGGGSESLTVKRIITEALNYDDVRVNTLKITTTGKLILDTTRNEL